MTKDELSSELDKIKAEQPAARRRWNGEL